MISLTDLLYIELSRLYQAKRKVIQDENQFRTRTLLKWIDQNFKKKKLPAEFALMNMRTKHMSRICNETKRTTTTELILQRILLEANRLLVHNDLSASELAYALG